MIEPPDAPNHYEESSGSGERAGAVASAWRVKVVINAASVPIWLNIDNRHALIDGETAQWLVAMPARTAFAPPKRETMMGRTSNFLFLAYVAVAGLGAAVPVRGQVAETFPDEANAIRAAAKEYVAAVRRGDFEAMRRIWTPDGDYVDASGRLTKVQELFRERPAPSPSNVESTDASVATSSLRFITPDVAIEDGTNDVAASPDGSVVSGRFTAVWVKRDGRWLLDGLREATATAPTPNNRLRPLEWLLGEWVGKTDDAEMLVSSHWSDSGNYIVREFLVRGEGREVLSGTERIGWDPVAGKIKSWMFDSHGGSGEGYWRRDGERWVVDSEEVMPDGKQSSASALFTPGGEGRFIWEIKSAKVGDVNLPTRRVEFKRAAEDE